MTDGGPDAHFAWGCFAYCWTRSVLPGCAQPGTPEEARRKAATHPVKTSLQKYSTLPNFGFMT
jgi:hypothetical protein